MKRQTWFLVPVRSAFRAQHQLLAARREAIDGEARMLRSNWRGRQANCYECAGESGTGGRLAQKWRHDYRANRARKRKAAHLTTGRRCRRDSFPDTGIRGNAGRQMQNGGRKGNRSHFDCAQYRSGGWPAVYQPGKQYHRHLTLNDNTMVNLMELLRDVSHVPEFAFLGNSRRERAGKAFDRGIACLVKASADQPER